ncbi:MAG: hypothetical protein IPK39_23835 [Sulfuritalea sp.]|nr:hypothetical protein [Sulfuritalea sp.]
MNRDILIRIVDDRIEVESPGVFPGITPPTSAAPARRRVTLWWRKTCAEFSGGAEHRRRRGVRMMFAEMDAASSTPPQYSQNLETAVESGQ